MRIAVVVGGYPRWSERFLLRDLSALAARGHDLRVWPVEQAHPSWLPPPRHDAEPVSLSIPSPPPGSEGFVIPPSTAVDDAVFVSGVSCVSGTLGIRRPTATSAWESSFSPKRARAALAVCGWRQPWRWWGRPGRKQGVRDAVRAWNGPPPDLVWAHFAYVPMVIGRALAAGWRCGLAASVHARDLWVPWRPGLRALAGADRVIGCHDAIAREALRLLPSAADRIRVCRHGLPLADFQPLDARPARPVPTVAAIGRPTPKKGFDVLIAAASRLRDQGMAFRLEFYGGADIAHARSWAALARRHGWRADPMDSPPDGLAFVSIEAAEPRCRWRVWPAQPLEALRERARRADVLVAPSRVAADGDRDGIPNVVLEAMALGVAVIGARVGGLPEILGEGAEARGLTVDADCPEALADAIKELLEHPDRRWRLAASGLRHVRERYDLGRTVLALEAALEEAAKNPGLA